MKVEMVKRGAGCRYDITLVEPFAGFPKGEVLGQIYANDYKARKPNPDRQILAMKIMQNLEGMKR